MSQSLTISLPDLAATERLGRRLGELLFPGAVVALIGPLGAGKTQLVRAVAEGVQGADSGVVSSPTFVLIQEDEGRLPIYHFDAYRLQSEAEFYDLGSHEYLAGDGVCLIEWADRVAGCLPREHLSIRLNVTGEHSREAVIEGRGGRFEAITDKLGSPGSDSVP